MQEALPGRDRLGDARGPRAALEGMGLVAHSPAMRRLVALIRAVANSDCAVLITGETGTGKEQVARALHAAGRHARGRLLAMHCAAIPPTLLERELFGHERGAFTGAEARQKGAFEAAAGGTFLLDEIGELEPSLQVKLLRVLQEKEIVRLGSTDPVALDVRILATTNRDLRAEVQRGAFRADLFFRLNTVELHVPPLRERREDIPALATTFLAAATHWDAGDGNGERGTRGETDGGAWERESVERRALSVESEAQESNDAPRSALHAPPPDAPRSTLSRPSPRPRELTPAAAAALLAYPWPGNVRELRSVIERACLLANGPAIEPYHLPPEIARQAPRTPFVRHLFSDTPYGLAAGWNAGPETRDGKDAGAWERGASGVEGGSVEGVEREAQETRDAPRSTLHAPRPSPRPGPHDLPDFREARRQFERHYFLQMLVAGGGNISAAARLAGLSWKHFRHKMHDLSIPADAWNSLAP